VYIAVDRQILVDSSGQYGFHFFKLPGPYKIGLFGIIDFTVARRKPQGNCHSGDGEEKDSDVPKIHGILTIIVVIIRIIMQITTILATDKLFLTLSPALRATRNRMPESTG
jgi:hypothetical protein